MSNLPGYQVSITDSAPTSSLPSGYGTLFAVGKATTPFELEEIYSIDQFEDVGGARDPSSELYDGIDTYFQEGGSVAYVSAAGLSAIDSAVEALIPNLLGNGSGQLAAFGLTSIGIQTALIEATNNGDFVAVLDVADSATAATLVTQAEALTAISGSQFAGLFAPWDIVPGIAGGTARTVPPSARICGNIARNEGNGVSPNEPAAGSLGIARFAYALSQAPFSAADRTTLNGAGVNLSRMIRQTVRTYGWRSLANQTTDANWSLFSGSRLVMAIKDDLGLVAENFDFTQLDGQNHTINKYAGAISGALQPYYANDDLYGDTASDAYSVDVGPAVNTLETIANGELHAKVGLRTSPFAEMVFIDIAKVPITQALATS